MLLNQFGQYLNMMTQLFTLPSNKKLGPLIVLGIDSHCTFPSRKSLTIVQKQAPLITAIIEQKKQQSGSSGSLYLHRSAGQCDKL